MEDVGSWLDISESGWSNMLTGANSEFLLERYREFLASVRAHRTCADDEGMSLATYALRAVEDVQSCLHFARKNNLSIALRLIPPPP